MKRKRVKLLQDICLLLAAVIAVQIVVISAGALEDLVTVEPKQVLEKTAFYEEVSQEEAPLAANISVETIVPELPAETEPAETVPEVTIPEETVPEETEPVRYSIDGVPLYFQTDYPNEMYGSGTVATSGCGITSLAMVATYLTDHVYTPDVLADYFGGSASNNIDRLEYACEAMQLPYEGILNFHETLEALKEGKVAIALMNEKSILTSSQHFVVFSGLTEDGKIIVLDPYEPNYSHWQLKNALVNGFKPGDLSGGFDGGWVFDKADMPEEPFLYEPEVYEGESRYDFELTQEEINLLARMVWVEAQGEPIEGQQAVAEVVLNRLAAENFQSTLRGVILAEGQFLSASKLDEAEPNQTQYDAIERALHGPNILPEDVVFFATFAVNKNVWGQIGDHVFCYQW